MTRSALGLFALLVSVAGIVAADEAPMHYTSEWAALDEPGAKGRQMTIVIHNTPQGEQRMVVKFALGKGFPIAHSVRLKDGTLFEVTFVEPARGVSILKQPVRIKSVRFAGKAVPPKPAGVNRADNPKAADDPGQAKAPNEESASSFLRFAKKLADMNMTDKARERLREIVAKFPGTKAAEEAKTLLEKLDKK